MCIDRVVVICCRARFCKLKLLPATKNAYTFNGPFSRTTQVTQKGQSDLDFTEARDSASDISWAICKSTRSSRQITMPAPHDSFFTGQMPFLPPDHQRQSTGDMLTKDVHIETDEEYLSRSQPVR